MYVNPHKQGLNRLTTTQLRQTLKLVYQEKLSCPIDRVTLMLRGLNALADHGGILFNRDAETVCTILSAVLLERQEREKITQQLRSSLERTHQALSEAHAESDRLTLIMEEINSRSDE